MKKEYHNYCFTLFLLKTDYKHVKLFLNACKNAKNVVISDDYHKLDGYHDIGQLLFLTIIADSKNWMISLMSKKISQWLY